MAAALGHGSTPPLERRRFCRVAATACRDIARARVRPGRDGSLLNLSRGGACIEVASRVLPGTPVEVQLAVARCRWSGRARVLRCRVSALLPEDGVRYQAALQFDPPVEASVHTELESALTAATRAGYQVPTEGVAAEMDGQCLPVQRPVT
jgi:hypothetical protein